MVTGQYTAYIYFLQGLCVIIKECNTLDMLENSCIYSKKHEGVNIFVPLVLTKMPWNAVRGASVMSKIAERN